MSDPFRAALSFQSGDQLQWDTRGPGTTGAYAVLCIAVMLTSIAVVEDKALVGELATTND